MSHEWNLHSTLLEESGWAFISEDRYIPPTIQVLINLREFVVQCMEAGKDSIVMRDKWQALWAM